MPQSLANILIHLTFSTKERRPFIRADVERDLHRYVAAIRANQGCPAHEVNGTEDHIHICLSLSRTMAVAALVEEVKRSSSKWIQTKGDAYRHFAWQAGYAAFSIGQSGLDRLKRYIASQKEHHSKRDFEAELRTLLTKYKVDHDERYVWD